jgi:tetratricopeptide (TPR) repeat protein
MNSFHSFVLRLLPVLCLLAPASLLAAGYEPDPDFVPTGSSGPQRRTVGLFTRLFNSPAKTNAAEQLAYARALEAGGHLRKALKAYKAGFLFYQTSLEAPEALRSYARLLETRGKYSKAFEEYQFLIDSYAGRFPYDSVIESQYALANQVRTERYGRWFFGIGFVSPERAIPLYFLVASNAPNWKSAPEALMSAGAIYQQDSQFDEAIRTYADLQTRYPDSEQAGEAAYQMVNSMMAIARLQRNNTQHTLNTRAALAQYLRDHPDSPHAEEVRSNMADLDHRQAQTLMDRAYVYEKAGRNKVAASIYRQLVAEFPQSPLAETASLKAETLTKEPSK